MTAASRASSPDAGGHAEARQHGGRGTRRWHRHQRDPPGRDDSRPRVQHPQEVVAPVEGHPFARWRAVLAPHRRHELPARDEPPVHHGLLPPGHERATDVARTHDDVHPVPLESAHQPARVPRPGEGELLLGDHDPRTLVRRNQVRSLPSPRPPRRGPRRAPAAPAGRTPPSAALGGPREQHALAREPVGGGLKGLLDRGGAGLGETHVEDDVCHDATVGIRVDTRHGAADPGGPGICATRLGR